MMITVLSVHAITNITFYGVDEGKFITVELFSMRLKNTMLSRIITHAARLYRYQIVADT